MIRWLLRQLHKVYAKIGVPPALLCLGCEHYPCAWGVKRLAK